MKATASGNVVTLTRPASTALMATSSPTALIAFAAGPPDLLAIVGKPQNGNTITITSPSAAQQGGGGALGFCLRPHR